MYNTLDRRASGGVGTGRPALVLGMLLWLALVVLKWWRTTLLLLLLLLLLVLLLIDPLPVGRHGLGMGKAWGWASLTCKILKQVL